MDFIFIEGNLAKDAERHISKNGREFVTFSVGTHRRDRDNKEVTTWYDVKVFDLQRYEKMFQYLTKGKFVKVRGALEVGTRRDDNGIMRFDLKINAEAIEFASFNGNNNGNQTMDGAKPATAIEPSVNTSVPFAAPSAVTMPTSDDIPMGNIHTMPEAMQTTSVMLGSSDDSDLPF
jgi:single stranded DNA-binding protein